MCAIIGIIACLVPVTGFLAWLEYRRAKHFRKRAAHWIAVNEQLRNEIRELKNE